MVASVWFSRSILTPSLASTAWCRPSLQRRPGIRRPVNSSTMMTWPSLHHVILVALEHHVGFQRLLHVMVDLDVGGVVEIADAEQLFDLQHAFFGQRDGAVLFVHRVIAGGVLFAGLLAFDHFAAHQLRDDAVDLVVLVGGFFAGAGDDQRRAGFVDQDGIDFVDDGEVVLALHAVLEAELHVVAQVVEAELVVGAVGDVAVVGCSGAPGRRGRAR